MVLVDADGVALGLVGMDGVGMPPPLCPDELLDGVCELLGEPD